MPWCSSLPRRAAMRRTARSVSVTSSVFSSVSAMCASSSCPVAGAYLGRAPGRNQSGQPRSVRCAPARPVVSLAHDRAGSRLDAGRRSARGLCLRPCPDPRPAPSRAREPDPHGLSARPRPGDPFRRLPPPEVQDPGVRLSRGRQLPHPADPQPGGRARSPASISRCLGLDEDLAEALALAHDLGHTPFGHAGEDALDACDERLWRVRPQRPGAAHPHPAGGATTPSSTG